MSELWIEGGMLGFVLLVFLTLARLAYNDISTRLGKIEERLFALEVAFWQLKGRVNGKDGVK